MCEIKLRCWSPDNQEMYYPDETYSFRVHKNSITFQPHYEDDTLDSFCTDPSNYEKKIEVMKWTGLSDKNGTEIFEGDIIETVSYKVETIEAYQSGTWKGHPKRTRNVNVVNRVVCEWEKYAFVFKTLNKNHHGYNIPSMIVIGNIYETPHLMK